MSGIDLNKPVGETIDDIPFDGPYVEEVLKEEEKAQGIQFDFGFLKSRTGPGTIEERVNHPMNFSKSKGVAQVIRGLEGLFGALDLAIIDVIMGLIEVIKERRVANAS
jgi:hypothetical protein